ncbi:MAG TPA: hypothetical protein VK157_16750 [Phycisphaerales bacterium]|nr:hypothetical protein [Phycisphaerales bacterium]
MPYDDSKQSRAAFLRKLTYYVSGIAIGFVVVGVMHNAKKQRMANIKQEETARQLAPKQSSPAFPPPPSVEGGQRDATGDAGAPGATDSSKAP